MDAEDYPSSEETSDEEYVPSDGEKVSEEEHSGEEEDFVPDGDDDHTKQGKGKRKRVKKKDTSRKRAGGIKLEGEDANAKEATDDYSKQLAEQVKQEQAQRKEDEEKKKTDSLWADFMKDVGGPKPKPKPTSAGLGSLASLSKSTTSSSKSSASNLSKAAAKPEPMKKVTVTKVFDFAGETVKVSKEVDANSKEAKAAQKEEQEPQEKKPTSGPSIPGLKRTGGGLGSVLGKIGKAPKMSVLDKSKLDWNSFKTAEGIDEELQIHNRGKQGYIERKQFLERTDLRQFELEKNMRQKNKRL